MLHRRCKSFGSSDRTGVGGCGSQSGSNSAVSGWWEEGESTGGRVGHGFEKVYWLLDGESEEMEFGHKPKVYTKHIFVHTLLYATIQKLDPVTRSTIPK